MAQRQSHNLILKIIIMGGFITALVYFFHPGVGQFSLVINGNPVADPLIRFAALPTMLITMALTGLIVLLAFLGIGLLLLGAAIFAAVLSVVIVAPYFWPMLVIIAVIILVLSLGNHKSAG